MNQAEFREVFEAFVESQSDADLRALLRQCRFNSAGNRYTNAQAFVVLCPSLEMAVKLDAKVEQLNGLLDLYLVNFSSFLICYFEADPNNPPVLSLWEICSLDGTLHQETKIR